MAVRLRLKRGGKKKQPVYRIVAIEHTNPRDGKEIEVIGQYNPRNEANSFSLNEERLNYWLKVGAKPSKVVGRIISKSKV
ncbi:MAG: 30S ribosomal protein S16 [Candidatus Margulisiibacteriota bacterium]